MTKENFHIKYDDYKKIVDDRLSLLLNFDSEVGQAMRYVALDGKRVRGVLVLATADMLGGYDENCVLAACAIECLHAYSLIHDDMPAMDNDDFRRGQPSCHKKFGEYIALLAGDALQTFAFQLISDIDDAKASRGCCRALAICGGANGMALGQELDLDKNRPSNIEQLNRLHRHKTGKLFECCALLACACKGVEINDAAPVVEFMSDIGLAFQIVDDMLDVTSTAEVLGKPICSDQKNGKVTYVSFMSIDECKSRALKITEDAAAKLKKAYSDSDFLSALATDLAARIS